MRRLPTAIAAAVALIGPLAVAPAAVAGRSPTASPEQRAAALVAQMTLDEKISQTHTTGKGAGGMASRRSSGPNVRAQRCCSASSATAWAIPGGGPGAGP